MRLKITLVAMTVMLFIAACSSDKPQPQSLVTSADAAPYYTDLAEALQIARPDQYVVIDFYTDT